MSDRERDIVDEEDAEIQRTHGTGAGGIPISWKSGNRTFARDSLIRAPTTEQVNLFTQTRVRTCSMCKHFKPQHFGDKKPIADKFMAQLVHDHQWHPKFIGDDPSKMGRCGEDPSLLVGPNSLGCSAFRAK